MLSNVIFKFLNSDRRHSDPKDTKIYCQLTRLWDDDNGTWLNCALKLNCYGGLDDSIDIAQKSQYDTLLCRK